MHLKFVTTLSCFAIVCTSSTLLAQRLTPDETKPLREATSVQAGAAYANPSLSAAQRATDVLKRLTFDEKLKLSGGYKSFCFPGIARLGLRPATMADASQGIRLSTIASKSKSTSFPGMLALASTWNPDIALQFGKSMGEECRALGVDILLGPGINMQRLSVGGRNYEYMGEDPLLTSDIAVSYIKGLQSKQVLATGKHFITNDQEFCRHIASSDVDERTLREIYLKPWEAAIKKGGLKAIMTGNNTINGIPSVMNQPTLRDILRQEFGFTGIAMSDWQNSNYFPHLQYLEVESGETLLMPENKTFVDYVNGYIKLHPQQKADFEKKLDAMIFPNLFTLFEMSVYDRRPADATYLTTIPAHKTLAKQCAQEAICLLKNDDHILPVSTGKKVLLTGAEELFSGTGSGFVIGYDHTSFADGLKKTYKNFTNATKATDDQIRNADVVIYNINKKGGEGYDVPFNEQDSVDNAGEIARITKLNKNVVVLVSSCNGMPMPWVSDVKGILYTYFLGQERGNALADIVSGKANPSGKLPFTIERDFNDSPDPDFNYIGGKPYWRGNNEYKNYWKGINNNKAPVQFTSNVKPHQFVHITYNEGVFMGYRWYEKYKKPVVFPFGYGLSYTSFDYSELKLSSNTMHNNDSVTVTLKVKNTGKAAGADVVQLYIADKESSVARPVKELKGFKKIFLKPGQSQQVAFTVNKRDLSFWDDNNHEWKAEPGAFDIMIGQASNNIKLAQSLNYN